MNAGSPPPTFLDQVLPAFYFARFYRRLPRRIAIPAEPDINTTPFPSDEISRVNKP